MATKQERPAKWRPDNRDPAKHRGRYLRAYRSARAVLEAGVPIDQARSFFELARSLALWDKGPSKVRETLGVRGRRRARSRHFPLRRSAP
jgi:hypothetical protein